MDKKSVYEEGHKRETRKSYQAYIEGISDPKAAHGRNFFFILCIYMIYIFNNNL